MDWFSRRQGIITRHWKLPRQVLGHYVPRTLFEKKVDWSIPRIPPVKKKLRAIKIFKTLVKSFVQNYNIFSFAPVISVENKKDRSTMTETWTWGNISNKWICCWGFNICLLTSWLHNELFNLFDVFNLQLLVWNRITLHGMLIIVLLSCQLLRKSHSGYVLNIVVS